MKGIGLRPVLLGNIKGLQDPYRNPTTQEGFAKQWGQKPHMVTSFADGTKVSFEMTVAANATGMTVAKRGMHGYTFDPGTPIMEAAKKYDADEILAGYDWGGRAACVVAALWPGVMNASHALARPGRLARALAVSNLSVAPAILAGVLLVGPLTQKDPQLAWNVLLTVQGAALLLAVTLLNLRVDASEPTETNLWRGWQRVGVLLPAAFAQTLAPGLLVTLFYPLLARLNLHLGHLILPGLLAAATFAASLALLGRVADRVHPRRALTPGLLLLAVTFTLVAFSDTPPVQQRLWFLATLLGAAYGAFIAGWNGLVGRTLPETHRAAGWGTVMTVESLGYAIGPLLGGVTWQLAGQRGVFLLGAAVFVLTELYYLWPARQVIRQTEPQPK